MSQRVMIAMAIACRPKLLIADEPTTALDVTIQAQIIELLLELQQQENMALMLITHDLALVAEAAQHIIVMYAGQVVESARATEIFRAPRHPYTQALLRSLPEFAADKARLQSLPGVVPANMTVRTVACLTRVALMPPIFAVKKNRRCAISRTGVSRSVIIRSMMPGDLLMSPDNTARTSCCMRLT